MTASGSAESAGVLVGAIGSFGRDGHVIGVVPTLSQAQPGEPALDLAKWGWVHSSIERYYRGGRAIGWYFSRPGHLAELDAHSIALHQSYFPHGPSMLLLIDPERGAASLHAGSDGALELIQQLAVGAPAGSVRPQRISSGLTTVGVVAGTCGVLVGVALWLWAGLPGGGS